MNRRPDKAFITPPSGTQAAQQMPDGAAFIGPTNHYPQGGMNANRRPDKAFTPPSGTQAAQ